MSENEILTEQPKDPKVNINMRVKESLRIKMKSKMEKDDKSADDFFSDMFYSYLKYEAEQNGEVDFSNDITELQFATQRVCSIFQGMIEKSYLNTTLIKEQHSSELADLKETIEKSYANQLSKLTQEKESLLKEYELISEQAHALIKDSKELKEKVAFLEDTNKKNEDLLITYKEQLVALKATNATLQNQLDTSINKSDLDKLSIEKDKELLEKDKHYQSIIADMQHQYNLLQLKLTDNINPVKK